MFLYRLFSCPPFIYLFLLCSYFKPTPRWDKETCTLHLPKSSPLQTFSSKDDAKYSKQSACLEACKQLHTCGALTDNLVPQIVAEESVAQECIMLINFQF